MPGNRRVELNQDSTRPDSDGQHSFTLWVERRPVGELSLSEDELAVLHDLFFGTDPEIRVSISSGSARKERS